MRPRLLSWHPPVEPSPLEQCIILRIKRANLFVFLRYPAEQNMPFCPLGSSTSPKKHLHLIL